MNAALNIVVRELTEKDWLEFAGVRLQALQTDPNAFGSNYKKESQFTEIEWRNRLKNNCVFLIENDEKIIGMTGVSIDANDATGKTAVLWGSWLAPDFRGAGISELMYRTRIEWAKLQPSVERLLVAHRASNRASERAVRKHGFTFTHAAVHVWSDGAVEDLLSYELRFR